MRFVEDDPVPGDAVEDRLFLQEFALTLVALVLSSECRLEHGVRGQNDIELEELLDVVAPIATVPYANLQPIGELVELVPPLHDGAMGREREGKTHSNVSER